MRFDSFSSKDIALVCYVTAFSLRLQPLSGPGVQFDGRILRAECAALGTKFDLRTGEASFAGCKSSPNSMESSQLFPFRSWALGAQAVACVPWVRRQELTTPSVDICNSVPSACRSLLSRFCSCCFWNSWPSLPAAWQINAEVPPGITFPTINTCHAMSDSCYATTRSLQSLHAKFVPTPVFKACYVDAQSCRPCAAGWWRAALRPNHLPPSRCKLLWRHRSLWNVPRNPGQIRCELQRGLQKQASLEPLSSMLA